jgi:hypothetical protein
MLSESSATRHSPNQSLLSLALCYPTASQCYPISTHSHRPTSRIPRTFHGREIKATPRETYGLFSVFCFLFSDPPCSTIAEPGDSRLEPRPIAPIAPIAPRSPLSPWKATHHPALMQEGASLSAVIRSNCTHREYSSVPGSWMCERRGIGDAFDSWS